MKLSRFRLAACLSICSAIFGAFTASVTRVVDSIALFVLATFDQRPQRFDLFAVAVVAPAVLGRAQTQSFVDRLAARSGPGRSRAPDSMAFVAT